MLQAFGQPICSHICLFDLGLSSALHHDSNYHICEPCPPYLRIFFIATIAVIAWLAEKVLKSRASLRVTKTRNVLVNLILRWIQGFQHAQGRLESAPTLLEGAFYIWQPRWFLLSKTAYLITTTLVQHVPIQFCCGFTEGLVFNETGPAIFTFPSVNGAP
jgi:hypothetical protein